ncbi:hypothetical protein EDD11_006888 [Mortierella claussenii]|nr:hypothetical protein EDD11_006888 [Mortierella claussenii]
MAHKDSTRKAGSNGTLSPTPKDHRHLHFNEDGEDDGHRDSRSGVDKDKKKNHAIFCSNNDEQTKRQTTKPQEPDLRSPQRRHQQAARHSTSTLSSPDQRKQPTLQSSALGAPKKFTSNRPSLTSPPLVRPTKGTPIEVPTCDISTSPSPSPPNSPSLRNITTTLSSFASPKSKSSKNAFLRRIESIHSLPETPETEEDYEALDWRTKARLGGHHGARRKIREQTSPVSKDQGKGMREKQRDDGSSINDDMDLWRSIKSEPIYKAKHLDSGSDLEDADPLNILSQDPLQASAAKSAFPLSSFSDSGRSASNAHVNTYPGSLEKDVSYDLNGPIALGLSREPKKIQERLSCASSVRTAKEEPSKETRKMMSDKIQPVCHDVRSDDSDQDDFQPQSCRKSSGQSNRRSSVDVNAVQESQHWEKDENKKRPKSNSILATVEGRQKFRSLFIPKPPRALRSNRVMEYFNRALKAKQEENALRNGRSIEMKAGEGTTKKQKEKIVDQPGRRKRSSPLSASANQPNKSTSNKQNEAESPVSQRRELSPDSDRGRDQKSLGLQVPQRNSIRRESSRNSSSSPKRIAANSSQQAVDIGTPQKRASAQEKSEEVKGAPHAAWAPGSSARFQLPSPTRKRIRVDDPTDILFLSDDDLPDNAFNTNTGSEDICPYCGDALPKVKSKRLSTALANVLVQQRMMQQHASGQLEQNRQKRMFKEHVVLRSRGEGESPQPSKAEGLKTDKNGQPRPRRLNRLKHSKLDPTTIYEISDDDDDDVDDISHVGSCSSPMHSRNRVSLMDRFEFCRVHVAEERIVPPGLKNNYPLLIDFGRLAERVQRIEQDLRGIIERTVQSTFLDMVLNRYKQMGTLGARNPHVVMANVEQTMPGYYGSKGSAELSKIIARLFLETDILTHELAHPQKPIEYIQQVLVPEAGLRLIVEDRAAIKRSICLRGGYGNGSRHELGRDNKEEDVKEQISLEEARQIMLESVEFGNYIHDIAHS